VSFFAADRLRVITGGRWLRRPDAEPLVGVGIDTRGDLARRVFVAIRGERHDGHDFLDRAAEAEAAMAIVDRADALPDGLAGLLVNDTRRALGEIARAWRRELSGPRVIAVTGSAGKTTTKNLIHTVLSSIGPGTAALQSFNNDIGVPLTLLAAQPGDRYVVVEVGTNHPGEIAALARLAEPDIAVITNIGRSHLEAFGSVEAIAREKASLLSHLKPDGLAVVCADAPTLEPYLSSVAHVLRFGEAETADLRLTGVGGRAGRDRWMEVNGRIRFNLALPGRHNAINALAAIGIGRRFGLDDARISETLRDMEPAPGRLVRRVAGEITIYDDTYNANPDSTAAALETFAELTADARRRVVVLGDMLELGEAGPDLHREVGRRLVALDARCPLHHVTLIGPLSAQIAEELDRAWEPERFSRRTRLDEDTMTHVAELLAPGDAVLIKASRGIGLDRLVSALDGHAAKRSSIVEPKGADAKIGT
jgi:UDP-N-acetylmuramoyl-tripeptide--D-alanyl-D-alanine ligase